ncbi:MAG: DUF364 domain-containing protein [Alphaproteobacteria bacterium]
MYSALAEGVSGRAGRVVVGLNWTMVEGPAGIGVAHTPARGTAGCRSTPNPGSYAGAPLAELAGMATSAQPFEKAIGMAAANAYWNRFDLKGESTNGLDLVEARGTRTVVIGRFPGLDERLPGCAVIEREPGPRDYPESAAAELLPQAEQVVITASTLANGSLPDFLSLLPRTAYAVLLGPSTPFSPVLFEAGFAALSGLVVRDAEAFTRTVAEGGAVAAFKRHARYVTLRTG